jgi:methanethiol S-methyltransferase
MSTPSPTSALGRALALGGGLLFAWSLLYFAASYLWWFDPPAGAPPVLAAPIAVDVALFTVFALHHSVFARTGLKRWVSAIVPPALERSTYVWAASLLFLATCAWWQPVGGALWTASGVTAAFLLVAQLAAGGFTLVAARSIGMLELAGVTQAWAGAAAPAAPVLDDRGPYRIVRHPIYLAWLVLVWAAPVMNGTRLVFAAVSTLYLVAAVPLEERDLRRQFGPAYDAYRRRVRWRLLPGIY